MTNFKILLLLILGIGLRGAGEVRAIDLYDYMGSGYDYNGFNTANSYSELTGHNYILKNGVWQWVHQVPDKTCPTIYNETCRDTDWHFPYSWRQKPNEPNIWFFNKSQWIGMNKEVFWADKDWDYVLSEGGWGCSGAGNTFSKNCFHSYYYPSYTNSGVTFPYRGTIWYKRNFTSGEMINVPALKVNNFSDNLSISKRFDGSDLTQFWWAGTITGTRVTSWDSALNTWNGLKDDGNLPPDMEVVVLDSESRAAGLREKYYYGRKAGNKFGMVRFESWNLTAAKCGTNCPNAVIEGDWVLGNYNTINRLTMYRENWNFDPENFFERRYYSEPKLEVMVPGTTLPNGRLPRGSIVLPGQGVLSDGTTKSVGTTVTLSEILTDSDWLISAPVGGSDCPNGYLYLGSVVMSHTDHRGVNGEGWAAWCGTNKNVLLAVTCPLNYESRGWLFGPNAGASAYDYRGKEIVAGSKIQMCVHNNEIRYEQIKSRAIINNFGDWIKGWVGNIATVGDLKILINNL